MTFGLVLLAAILMWTMWICAFMHQMYPLARPTVPKPNYRVRCVRAEVCANFTKELCNSQLWGYSFDDVANQCKCITDPSNPNYDA